MIRKLVPLSAAVCLVLAANAPRALAAVEILFCRGPLPYSLDINGILTIHNKPAPGPAGQFGTAVPPGTCALLNRGITQAAPLVFRGPALNIQDADDQIRQQGMFGRVVSALTASLSEPTAVFGFFMDTDGSGKPTGVNRLEGNALNYAVSVSFSAVPKSSKFDPSSFRLDAPNAVLEKAR